MALREIQTRLQQAQLCSFEEGRRTCRTQDELQSGQSKGAGVWVPLSSPCTVRREGGWGPLPPFPSRQEGWSSFS